MRKIRKYLCSLLSVSLLLTLLLSPVATATAATSDSFSNDSLGSEFVNLSNMYRKYDLETGEVSLVPKTVSPTCRNGELVTSTKPYIPDQSKIVQYGERTLFGDYTRRRVTETTNYPYRAIARLHVTYTDNTEGYATGFMVSSNVMLTAGHVCMSSTSNAPVRSMTAYLGQNGSYTPNVAYASSYYVCANFTYYNDDDQDDYAIVVLNSDVGNTTGWFGLDSQAMIFFYNEYFAVTGYPLDMPTGTMWEAIGPIEECTTYVLRYKMDTYSGQSGSPLYTLNGVAYGINVSQDATGNNARRMTQEVIDWLLANGFIS